MILIIGGAYQGKLEYVSENYPGKSVFQCDAENTEIDFSADVINSLHLLLLAQIKAGMDCVDCLNKTLPKLKDKIIICDDITCGVVPVDGETRQWREAVGRCMTLISKNADEVIRVFCGIGTKIK